MASTFLKISPEVIEFPAVLNQNITTNLILENVSARPVAFKIKVTAPENYRVRPSTGVIPRNGHQDVQIMLQPLAAQPTDSDRFLVQATPFDDEKSVPPRDFWVNISKNEVSQQRLNVVFKRGVNAAGAPQPNAASQSEHSANEPQDLSSRNEALQAAVFELGEENKQLKQDNENLRKRISQEYARKGNGAEVREAGEAATASSSLSGLRFEIWHLIPIVILALVIGKLLMDSFSPASPAV